MGSTTSHHFATPHNNNTTSPQLKTTKPTPHGQNAVHHHHRSLPCPRGRCLCPVQWHCSIWHCHGHRFRLWRRHWLQPTTSPIDNGANNLAGSALGLVIAGGVA